MNKRFFTEIIVNGEALELTNQTALGIRLNASLFKPESVDSTSAEYSFTFEVPQTAKNNRIFGLANVPSIRGKFVRMFDTEVLVDGINIFSGVLRLASVKKDSYSCNLISLKNNSVDDIFGESTMNEIEWYVPYNGAETINTKNEEEDPDYFFPLVCYGAFQKDPSRIIYDSDGNIAMTDYTSLMKLDEWVKYYGETFIPSPKLIEVIKRMLEQKGYSYGGNVFSDPMINKLYLSSYLGDKQDPDYNLGGDRGKITINYNFWTKNSSGRARRTTFDLKYPTEELLWQGLEPIDDVSDEAVWYDVLENKIGNATFATTTQNNYNMWENGDIVIPSSGYYKIDLDAIIELNDPETRIDLAQFEMDSEGKIGCRDYNMVRNLMWLPHELHLVKHTSDTNMEYIATRKVFNWRHSKSSTPNNRVPDYPHEAPQPQGISNSDSYYQQFTYTHTTSGTTTQGKTRAYDPWVNDNFIMGCSTASACYGVIKSGRSWNKEYAEQTYSNYKCEGYIKYHREIDANYNVSEQWLQSDYNQIMDGDVPESSFVENSLYKYSGRGYAVVWLNKGDMLSLRLLTKNWKNYGFNYQAGRNMDESAAVEVTPKINVRGTLKVEAMSPNKRDLKKSWTAPSAFTTELNLGHFLSNSEKQKDFFENFITTFNLETITNGNEILINTKSSDNAHSYGKIDIDDRVNSDVFESEVIDFPSKIDLSFTIDDEEAGFYHSVPKEHLYDDKWKSFADIGSEPIIYQENIFSTNTIEKKSKFSRTWYMDFTLSGYWKKVWIPSGGSGYWNFVRYNTPVTLSIPVIAKDENFIDGGDYESYMKKDGRGLKQRLWFKGENTPYQVPNRNGAVYDDNRRFVSSTEYINITLPTPYYNGYDVLRYVNEDNTLTKMYYSIENNADNDYCIVEVYLTPEEYMRLKGGCLVRFDNDVYRICSIEGYDPTGNSLTKLRMVK